MIIAVTKVEETFFNISETKTGKNKTVLIPVKLANELLSCKLQEG